MAVTAFPYEPGQHTLAGCHMPILMLGMIAFGAFAVIGLLLATASLLEHKRKAGSQGQAGPH
jgi:hypothetical protein